MKRKAYSRGERESMILDVLYTMVGDGNEPYVTAYGMAKELGMNSAQHVRNIMEKMVKDGKLAYVQKQHRPGVTKRLYCPVPLLKTAWEDDAIAILFKVNGKEIK